MKAIDIALKDMLQSFRSMFALAFMFVVPILITGMFVFLFSGMGSGDSDFDLPQTQVQIVNEDQGEAGLGQMLVDSLQSEGLQDLMAITEVDSDTEARAAVDQQAADVAVIIPDNFSAVMSGSGGHAEVELYQDPTLTLGPKIVSGVIQQFLDSFAGSQITINVAFQQLSATGNVPNPTLINNLVSAYIAYSQSLGEDNAPLLDVRSVSGSQEDTSMVTAIVGMISGGMMIFYAYFTGVSSIQSILREEERGTLPRIFTTPTSASTVLTGKFLAAAVMILVQVTVLMIFGTLVFNIQWGNLAASVLVVLGIVISASAFGILVNSLMNSTRQAGVVIGGGLTVTGMLGMSGIFTMGAPGASQATDVISLLVPQGWVVRALQQAMQGAANSEILLTFGGILAWSVVFFVIGVLRFRKRFA
ncbi:MAG: ABC transporter permease [Anaerolineales bacterium]|nr:ABC transporter permease [Anaerolineales bacterium]